jgi:hypothetical protein
MEPGSYIQALDAGEYKAAPGHALLLEEDLVAQAR